MFICYSFTLACRSSGLKETNSSSQFAEAGLGWIRRTALGRIFSRIEKKPFAKQFIQTVDSAFVEQELPIVRRSAIEVVYLSIDVEASGPFPGLFSLVSIGAVLVKTSSDGLWIVDEETSFYEEMQHLPKAGELEAATNIHGLTREYLDEHGRDPGIVTEEFADFLDELNRKYKKVVPAAWPASFDAPFVGWYLQYFLDDNPLGWSCFDIPSFGMGLFQCHRNALRNLMKKAGIEFGKNPNAHNALADATEQGQTLANLLNHARKVRKEKNQ